MDRRLQHYGLALAFLALSAPLHAQTSVNVVTYNVHKNKSASITAIVSLIQQDTATLLGSSLPPIVALQEVRNTDVQSYVTALQAAYPGTTWSSVFKGDYCDSSNYACWNQVIPPDQQHLYESATTSALFTAFTLVAPPTSTWIMAQDQFEMGRAVVQMRVQLASGLEANFFSTHAPFGNPNSSVTFSIGLQQWASQNSGLKLIGGDFNEAPGLGLYNDMTSGNYVDAWQQFTHSTSGGQTCCAPDFGNRFDYWFAKSDGGSATATNAVVDTQATLSDHRPLFVAYTLAGSTVKINFQPSGAPVPSGYLQDTGVTFADRGNGQTYGWNGDNTINTRDRNAANSPDQRYDTLTYMQRTPNPDAFWEIALANGTYSVRLVAGDPSFYGNHMVIAAEGVVIVDGTTSSNNPWFDRAQTVTVSDGRLTISNAVGADGGNKICFIEITPW